jgi:hypothetical protein
LREILLDDASSLFRKPDEHLKGIAMPDAILFLKAMFAAALVAAAFAAVAVPLRRWSTVAAELAVLTGLGLAVFVGCWLVGLLPNSPESDDQGRVLYAIFPAALLAEGMILLTGRRLGWETRLFVAVAAGYVLLAPTIYLKDLAGPGSRLWSTAQASLALLGLGAALFLSWQSLASLERRLERPIAAVALSITILAAGVAIMLSGYLTAGQRCFPLAAGLLAAAAVTWLSGLKATGLVGAAFVLAYAVVLSGYFFTELTLLHAALLIGAPQLAWLSELPPLRRRRWLAAALTIIAVALPPGLAVYQASRPAPQPEGSPGRSEPSLDDYLGFGK